MKSLRESLFDDNITKDMTFGDLYKLDNWKVTTHYWPIARLYKSSMIMKDAKYGENWDLEDCIVNGLARLILNIPLSKGFNREDLANKLRDFEKYYKSIVSQNKSLRDESLPYPFAKVNGHLQVNRDWNVFDVDEIEITFCYLRLVFRRK